MFGTNHEWLKNVKVGDKVIVDPNELNKATITSVIRVTNNFIITEGDVKWRKENGSKVGTNLWRHSDIGIGSPEEIERIAIENPVSIISSKIKKPDQIIQPWMFGHMETKATCLWLKNLPKLEETNNVFDDMMKLPKKERNRIHYLPPSADRWKLRSKTYDGIADCMAKSWAS